MKYLIIGGVAGGATAAARMRRIDENAEIILLEKGNHISFANCGLPYYIGNTIENRNALFIQTPESFGNRFDVDVRVNNEVMQIFPDEKSVLVKRGNGNTYREKYDKLLIATGASAIIPQLEGVDLQGIFTLRNIEDTDNIKNYVFNNSVKNAVIVGAGFIGLEMAENLHNLGVNVSIVEKVNQVMPPLDFEMAAMVSNELRQKNVALYLENGVQKFERKNDQLQITLQNGEIIETEMVILSVGIRPNSYLAQESGIKIGTTGGIWVDEYLGTSVSDIYAVGDVIEFPHPLTGKPWLNFLANPANRQGRIVADNMVQGNHIVYEGAIGTAIAKVFDITVASTGLSEKQLQRLAMPFLSSISHSFSHAGYYPDSHQMCIKLTFNPENGEIFGAQAVGRDGVDKRIDQIALLIKHKGTIYDLMEVEHCYAPPFSAAKDPIAIAGYVANNIISGAMPVFSWQDIVENRLPQNAFLLDVRTPKELEQGMIENAVNIPLDELRFRLDEVPMDQPIYVYCAIGLRGYLATKILLQSDYTQVWNLLGGYKTFSAVVNSKR